jgi:hypothetical protein
MYRGWMRPSIIKLSSSLIEYADYFSQQAMRLGSSNFAAQRCQPGMQTSVA